MRGTLPTRARARRPLRAGSRKGESGSTLILALMFMIVAGLLVGALADSAANDLGNTLNFKSARDLQSDARAAINEAIQSIRYNPLLTSSVTTLDASPPVACWQKGTAPYTSTYSASDGNSIGVWCSTAYNPSSGATRVVTFSACLSGVGAYSCAARPLLQAVVTFDDYPSGYTTAPPPPDDQCVTYCGTDMTVDSLIQDPTMPTVTGIGLTGASPPTCPAAGGATGPVTGGTEITICGTGFVQNATTVNFVEESGNVQGGLETVPLDDLVCSSNLQLGPPCTVTNVTVNSATQQITADAPEVTQGSTYFVTVTTPSGTSAYGYPGSPYNSVNDVYTYATGAPILSNTTLPVQPLQGDTVGGTEVTLTGSDFITGSCVDFVEENGGTALNSSPLTCPPSPSTVCPPTCAAQYVSPVTLDGTQTVIQAVAPAIFAGSYLSYFVEVVSPSGAASSTVCPSGDASTCDVFQYLVSTPLVSGIVDGMIPSTETCSNDLSVSESASGPPGTTVTLCGTGFYTGESVTLEQEYNGGAEEDCATNPSSSGCFAVPSSNVNVLSGSELTVSVPTPSSGSTFFVEVTTPNPFPCDNNADGSNVFCTSNDQAVVFSYPPMVTGISPMSPSTGAAGSTLTINGHYFASDDNSTPTVSLLEESSNNLASPPVTVAATNVQVTSYSVITATVPPIEAGTTYFVTVTTPGGVSWTSGSPYPPVFRYSPPTVTQVNPNKSGTAGATVTVTGTDFYSTGGTTVTFVPVGGGSSVAGTNVTVVSSSQLSVKVPTLPVNTEYYVEVTTPAGTNTTSSQDEYEFT
jgi:hypothetical protein